MALTSIPTAAGREHRVIRWVDDWIKARKNLTLRRDRYGNMLISRKGVKRTSRPLLFTAHLDHPAFVITKVVDGRTLEAEFRGGVRPPYFPKARVVVYDHTEATHRGTIALHATGKIFDHVVIRLAKATNTIAAHDIAMWDLNAARVTKGLMQAPACDDLAGVAAALSAMDVLRAARSAGDVRGLLTRAEEVGFIGAIDGQHAIDLAGLAIAPTPVAPVLVPRREAAVVGGLHHQLGMKKQHIGPDELAQNGQQRLAATDGVDM